MEDAAIVDLYWARSERAISESKKKYGAYCRNIAFRITRLQEDAEECENDTYLRAWNAMPDARPSFLGAFLGAIARNLALDRYKAKKRSKRGESNVDLLLDELGECVASADDPLAGLQEIELVHVLNGFLEKLSQEKRRIFVQRYWYGCTITEIAEENKCGEAKVKTCLHRLRKELEVTLTAEGAL